MTTNSNKIEDFLQKLAQRTPQPREIDSASKNRKLEKVYLSYPGNYGRYQILPMDNIITDFPFSTLFDTYEVNIPRKNIGTDGKESVYEAWIKLLPKEGYIMRDDTGRVVSSLTASDEQLLDQARYLFKQLYDELDVRNNQKVKSIANLLRIRNYTVFHGMCLNKWSLNDTRTPNRQNFSALFVCSAKGFMTAIKSNIDERTLMNNNDDSWIPLVYNRQLTGRDGFLMFSISMNKQSAGYVVTANHEFGRAKSLEGFNISEEDAELMSDPIKSFLGWQAAKDDTNNPYQKRLFNAPLIQETIRFMSQQLAAIRMAKQTGVNIEEAINRTNQEALSSQVPTNTMGEATNDPVLASMSAPVDRRMNPENIVNNNDNPFQTPPAANVDPVTSAPVVHNNPVNNPGFGNFGNPSEGRGFTPTFGTNGFGGSSF